MSQPLTRCLRLARATGWPPRGTGNIRQNTPKGYSAQRGLEKLWDLAKDHKPKMTQSGELAEKRHKQRVGWMWGMIEDRLKDSLKSHPKVVEILPPIQKDVAEGRLTVNLGAQRILSAYHG